MTERMQKAVKAALEQHGKNTWGVNHSASVIEAIMLDETAVEKGDLDDAMKEIRAVINPSAFAQWLENHLKGFQRQTRAKSAEKILLDFGIES